MNLTGKFIPNINITGKFVPFLKDKPVLMEMPGEPDKWIAIYTKEDDLHKTMERCEIVDYNVKVIENGQEFFQSIMESAFFRIMLDPKIVDNQKTRWLEVMKETHE